MQYVFLYRLESLNQTILVRIFIHNFSKEKSGKK